MPCFVTPLPTAIWRGFACRSAGLKSKPRLWRKLCKPRYVERIKTVEDIPDVIDDLLGVRLTCTNRRDIDVVREVLDELPTTNDGQSVLWLDPGSERDYLDEPRSVRLPGLARQSGSPR